MFREGSMREVYILGSLWNANATPPADNSGDEDNLIKLIRTKGGHEIEFNDTKEEGTVTIKSKRQEKFLLMIKTALLKLLPMVELIK